MRKVALLLSLLVALLAGAFGFDGFTYGAANGGAVIRTKAPLPSACIGFEVWGAPGFFGSPFDAGECDI